MIQHVYAHTTFHRQYDMAKNESILDSRIIRENDDPSVQREETSCFFFIISEFFFIPLFYYDGPGQRSSNSWSDAASCAV